MKECGWLNKKSYSKHKTWIYLAMTFYMAIVVIRYIFNLYGSNLYAFLLAVS